MLPQLVQVETEASQENKRLNGMVETLRNEVTTVRAKEVESKNLHDTAVRKKWALTRCTTVDTEHIGIGRCSDLGGGATFF